mgnify:CR=1 FL=1|jgi:hypothetical protein|tara:strand:+ start:1279 stop:1743 length:465 start_codon:yes stop_codon:yes gene_type:complete
MLRLKSRASCQCFTNNTTSCAKNVTIAQPRAAPQKPNRTQAHRAKGFNDTKVVGTFVPNSNSVQNSYFMSGGFGAPQSVNRKQRTLGLKDKLELSSVSTNNNLVGEEARKGTMFKNGYITKSQSKLQSNTGSMDRLSRLKAVQVFKSKSHPNDN